MHTFVISLDRSLERRSVIMARLKEIGLQAEVFRGIDGAALSGEALRYRGRVRRLLYGKDMTAGEIGCARSHIELYAEIVRRQLPSALILEDDAILTEDLGAMLTALQKVSEKWDLVRFLGKTKDLKRMRPVLDLGDGRALTRIYGTPGGAYAYVVNLRAAERLAYCGSMTWMPIDTLHGQVWWHRLRVRGLLPPPVLPDHSIPSTIGDKRFSKRYSLSGWERAIFPVTRYAFKLFDAAAKQGTYWMGVVKDRIEGKRMIL